jgi:hypothetical protein
VIDAAAGSGAFAGRWRALGVAAALSAAALVSTAPTAEAVSGPPTGRLAVTKAASGGYDLTVSGVLPATQAEAQAVKDAGRVFVLTLFGDDPAVDDDIAKWTPRGEVTPTGLRFHSALHFSARRLNEDPWPERGDELFVRIELKSRTGQVIMSARTNRVDGRF